QGFQWLACYDNEASVVAYLRQGRDSGSAFAVVGHFTPVVRKSIAWACLAPGSGTR
ncbi:MAG: hypothetical protein RIS54_1268, partial [Verrucomicrobiota bacterium]